MNLRNTLMLACLAALPAAAQIPVHCGDVLNVPGGLYVLTGNLTCPASPAVHIGADNVTFDLQGYTLSKSGAATGSAIITAVGSSCVVTSGVTVANGTISNFGVGMSLCVPGSAPVSTNATIHHLTITGGNTGMTLFNSSDNDIHLNTIVNNVGTLGTYHGMGIVLLNSNGNNLHQNDVNGNASDGLALVFSANDNNLMHNVTKNNGGSGILVGSGSGDNVIKMNEATGNALFDLKDSNPACGTNTWKSDTFGTRSLPCIK